MSSAKFAWRAMGRRFGALVVVGSAVALAACSPPPEAAAPPAGSGAFGGAPVSTLTGEIKIDGSSTVFPISQAVAEKFMETNPGVKISVAMSGTGGGMKKFTAGEIDICDASRPIKDSELQAAKDKALSFVELPIAYDGLAVVVNKENTWATELTVDELKKIWQPDSTVNNWQDVRAGFPDVPLKLYGPGTDSGTFDYFTEEINGESKASRDDYTPSEDDNVLVKGVEGDRGALGYFGHAYYEENKDKLNIVKIGPAGAAVEPTTQTIADGTYTPLSRPLFLYIANDSLGRPEVDAFIKYYLANVAEIAAQVGYVALPTSINDKVKARLDAKELGSIFSAAKNQTVDAILSGAQALGEAGRDIAVGAGEALKAGAEVVGDAAQGAAEAVQGAAEAVQDAGKAVTGQ